MQALFRFCGGSASNSQRTAGPLHSDGYRTQSEASHGTVQHCIQPGLHAGRASLTESNSKSYGMMRLMYTSLYLATGDVANLCHSCLKCTGIFAGITAQAKFTDQMEPSAC